MDSGEGKLYEKRLQKCLEDTASTKQLLAEEPLVSAHERHWGPFLLSPKADGARAFLLYIGRYSGAGAPSISSAKKCYIIEASQMRFAGQGGWLDRLSVSLEAEDCPYLDVVLDCVVVDSCMGQLIFDLLSVAGSPGRPDLPGRVRQLQGIVAELKVPNLIVKPQLLISQLHLIRDSTFLYSVNGLIISCMSVLPRPGSESVWKWKEPQNLTFALLLGNPSSSPIDKERVRYFLYATRNGASKKSVRCFSRICHPRIPSFVEVAKTDCAFLHDRVVELELHPRESSIELGVGRMNLLERRSFPAPCAT